MVNIITFNQIPFQLQYNIILYRFKSIYLASLDSIGYHYVDSLLNSAYFHHDFTHINSFLSSFNKNQFIDLIISSIGSTIIKKIITFFPVSIYTVLIDVFYNNLFLISTNSIGSYIFQYFIFMYSKCNDNKIHYDFIIHFLNFSNSFYINSYSSNIIKFILQSNYIFNDFKIIIINNVYYILNYSISKSDQYKIFSINNSIFIELLQFIFKFSRFDDHFLLIQLLSNNKLFLKKHIIHQSIWKYIYFYNNVLSYRT